MLGVLAVFECQSWLSVPPARASDNSAPQLVRYFVSWHVTEHGSSSATYENHDLGGRVFVRGENAHSMRMEATGSAIVRYRADNGYLYDTQFLNVTLLVKENGDGHFVGLNNGRITSECMSTMRETNLDPSAYSGFYADYSPHHAYWDLLGGSGVDPARRHVNRLENAYHPLWGGVNDSKLPNDARQHLFPPLVP